MKFIDLKAIDKRARGHDLKVTRGLIDFKWAYEMG